jgi:preprotein translocase subunit SecB
MRLSPLSLKNYFTTQLFFSATPDFDVNEGSFNIDISDLNVEIQEYKSEENNFDRACQILIELKDANASKYPYEFSISLIGFFEINSNWNAENINALFSSNAPALLYSAARHALATATGTGPNNKVVLPSVTFVQVPAQVTNESLKSDETKKPPSEKKVVKTKKKP